MLCAGGRKYGIRSVRRRCGRPSDAAGGRGADRQDVIAEIRVHGNAYLKDEEVIRLAGIAVGQSLDQNGVDAIEQRLESSGFFDTVEVRKRYRSLDAAGDVAIVLLVLSVQVRNRRSRPSRPPRGRGAGSRAG